MASNPLEKFDYAHFTNIWRAQWQKKAEEYRVSFKKQPEEVKEVVKEKVKEVVKEVVEETKVETPEEVEQVVIREAKVPEPYIEVTDSLEDLQKMYELKFWKPPHFSFATKPKILHKKIYS